MANNIDDLESIFETCLEDLQSGNFSIEEVLARYPEAAPELRPRLEAVLWLQAQRSLLDPRPGFVIASRRRLVERIREDQIAQARPISEQIGAWIANMWKQLVPAQGPARKKFAFQLAMIVILLFSMVAGSTGVAYAAQNSIPGDRLYPVKLTIEDGQLFLSPGLAGDIGLHITFSSRRLVEIQSLIMESRLAYIAQTVNRFEDHVFQAVRLLERLAARNAARASELAVDLSNTLASHTEVLKVLAQALPEQNAVEIRHAFLVTQVGATAVQEVLTEIGVPVSTATQEDAGTTPTLSIVNEMPVFTPTSSPSSTATATPTLSLTWTPSPSPTGTASVTPSATVVIVSQPTATPSGGVNTEPTNTPRPTNTPVPPTDAPTDTPEPSNTPKPTKTPKPLPSPTRRPSKDG